MGSCVYHDSHCDIQLQTLTAVTEVPRLTKPSTLCGMVNCASALGLNNNTNGDGGCRWQQPFTGGLTAQVNWLDLRVGSHLSAQVCIHQMNRMNSHNGFGDDDSTISISVYYYCY